MAIELRKQCRLLVPFLFGEANPNLKPSWLAIMASRARVQTNADPKPNANPGKRQHSISLSSTEAEIMAASLAAQEAIFHRSLFAEMGFDMSEPTTLWVECTQRRRSSFDGAHVIDPQCRVARSAAHVILAFATLWVTRRCDLPGNPPHLWQATRRCVARDIVGNAALRPARCGGLPGKPGCSGRGWQCGGDRAGRPHTFCGLLVFVEILDGDGPGGSRWLLALGWV